MPKVLQLWELSEKKTKYVYPKRSWRPDKVKKTVQIRFSETTHPYDQCSNKKNNVILLIVCIKERPLMLNQENLWSIYIIIKKGRGRFSTSAHSTLFSLYYFKCINKVLFNLRLGPISVLGLISFRLILKSWIQW